MRGSLLLGALFAAVLAAGCDPSTPSRKTSGAQNPAASATRPTDQAVEGNGASRNAAPAPAETQDDGVAQGRQAYLSSCIACHNADPTQEGSLGPALAGSSRELLEAKVLRGEFPAGYTPKRPSRTMPKFEYLADGIDGLAAYLATF
jgi:mono/diheme cytochrome c family protein